MESEYGSVKNAEVSAIVGRRLRHFRESRRASKTYVAENMRTAGFDWTHKTVALVESGHRSLTLDEFCVLAVVIGAEPADFWVTT